MYLNRTFSRALIVAVFAHLVACQSTRTHEFLQEGGAERTEHASTLLSPNPANIEELEDDAILPHYSSQRLDSLTPAAYYYSPDPPENLPEYIPSVFFGFDSWKLSNKGKQILELTAAQLKKDKDSTLIIEGHCDPQGAETYNLVLGDKRAEAIRDYLTSLGVENERLIPVSFGESHPVCLENHEKCHALNRRGYLVSHRDTPSSTESLPTQTP